VFYLCIVSGVLCCCLDFNFRLNLKNVFAGKKTVKIESKLKEIYDETPTPLLLLETK